MSKRKYTDEDVVVAVKNSVSIAGVLVKVGLVPAGGNYKLIRMRIRTLGLDISHFTGQGHLKGKSHNWAKKIPLSEIMIRDSQYKRTSSLRERLIREGVFDHICHSCGNTLWMDKPIPLELDHINGVNNDHRRKNLRLLCPNCHAFTPTYRGRNIDKSSVTPKEILLCRKCGKVLSEKRKTGMCGFCRWKNATVAQLAGGISLKN